MIYKTNVLFKLLRIINKLVWVFIKLCSHRKIFVYSSCLLLTRFIITYLSRYLLTSSYLLEWEIYVWSGYSINFISFVDLESCIFCVIVSFISYAMFKFSRFYMQGSRTINYYYFLLFLFVLRIFALIFTPSLISIILGWDGLGVISYLLVIFYASDIVIVAGLVTIIRNRVGDGILIFLVALNLTQNNLDFINWHYLNRGVAIFLILWVIGSTKRAQIPFISWLPIAMAAPTPVSALVHSSTLVTAGVYVLLRTEGWWYLQLSFGGRVLVWLCILTSVSSAMAACYIKDFKKIIAMSTLNQIALIFTCISIEIYDFVFFHLVVHALLKSWLFLTAGLFIKNNLHHSQNYHFQGNNEKSKPLLIISFLFSNYCLCRFPFLAAFYSKNIILEEYWLAARWKPSIPYYLICLGILTVMYRIRFSKVIFTPYINKTPLSGSKDFYSNLSMLFIFGVFILCVTSSLKIYTNLSCNLIILPLTRGNLLLGQITDILYISVSIFFLFLYLKRKIFLMLFKQVFFTDFTSFYFNKFIYAIYTVEIAININLTNYRNFFYGILYKLVFFTFRSNKLLFIKGYFLMGFIFFFYFVIFKTKVYVYLEKIVCYLLHYKKNRV